jgi:hypothetical protein
MGPFLKAVTKVVIFFKQMVVYTKLNTGLPVFVFNVKIFNFTSNSLFPLSFSGRKYYFCNSP